MPWAAISLLRRRFRAPYWHLKRSGRTAASYCSATKRKSKPYSKPRAAPRSASTSLRPRRSSRWDHPAKTFQAKADSSITVGFGYLAKGAIDGFASAGSTGAMMVGSMYAVKPIEGVIRPTISSIVPTIAGRPALLLDVGLNVDCKPEVLAQYGLIGSIYAEAVLGIGKPRVAVLNIGEEETKGNAQTKATYELLKEDGRINFVGNVEGSYIFTGQVADVIVCDGFVGNTVLKMAEGLYRINKELGGGNAFWDAMNYENVGGTPVLGVNAPVIIGHGISSARAIKSMILSTEQCIKADLTVKLQHAFKN